MTETASTAQPFVTLPDRFVEFLSVPRYAAIATLDADGTPRQAFIWYLLVPEGLVINSRAERRWPRNLQRDPRIHVAIQDWQKPNHWLGGSGRAEFLHDGPPALEDIQAMARRYGGNPDAYAGQSRISFLVRFETTFEYGA